MTHKKIKIEIEIVDDDQNVGCAFYSETGDVLYFNKMDHDEKKRVAESLGAFAQLFNRFL